MMNCKDFERLKEKYLNGEMGNAEEEAMEAHLESCSTCRKIIDDLLAETEKVKTPPEPVLDEKKQRSILRRAKYKNRFSIAVFLLLLLLGLRIAGGFLSGYYFNWGQEESRLYRTQQTAALLTEFSFPNVTLPLSLRPLPVHFSMAGWGHSSLEIKPYFAARGSYALKKQVGKESTVIGHLNINHFFSAIVTQWEWEDYAHNDYLYFYHPAQLADPRQALQDGKIPGEILDTIFPGEPWEALDILPEGSVAEMSFSFIQTYSVDEVKEMLEEYDLEITWFAVSTGLEQERSNDRHPEPLAAIRGAWGVPYLSRNMLYHFQQIDANEHSNLLEEYYLYSMGRLVENEAIARRLYRGNPEELRLAERYAYIKEHGLQVYGVVVTGPTKELLRLRELETIHSPALGEVELWNWFHRNFRSTLY